MTNNTPVRLGIDLGTASIGIGIVDANTGYYLSNSVRIFDDGRDPESKKSLATKRREARQLRRQIQRAARRAKVLKNFISRMAGSHVTLSKVLKGAHARRAMLDATPQTGVDTGVFLNAIIHMSNYRGWKSPMINPPPVPEMTDYPCDVQIDFMSEGKRYRNSGDVIFHDKVHRQHVMDEFHAIFDNVQRCRPDIFTDHWRTKIFDKLFYHRPLKEGVRGKCSLIDGHVRTWKTSLNFQKFRVRKTLSDLRMSDRGRKVPIYHHKELMDAIELKVFESACDSYVKWKSIEKMIKDSGHFSPNSYLDYGGLTKSGLATFPGPREDGTKGPTADYSEESCIILYQTMQEHGVDETGARSIIANTRDDIVSMSTQLSSIQKMNRVLSVDELESIFGEITDPTVVVILNQFEKVLNHVVKQYTNIVEISVESSREIGRGYKADLALRRRINSDIKTYHRFEENRKRAEYNAVHGIKVGNTDRMKKRLIAQHLEQCVYCGARGVELEVEHILAQSRTAVDHINNLVLSCHSCNHSKGEDTPFEFISRSPHLDMDAIKDRARVIGAKTFKDRDIKLWRFEEDAMEQFELGCGVSPAALNQLRWAEKLARYALEPLKTKVNVIRGIATSRIRQMLGISKDRSDHRHHGVDALMIALAPSADSQQLEPLFRALERPHLIRSYQNAINKTTVSIQCDRFPSGHLHLDNPKKQKDRARNDIVVPGGNHEKVFEKQNNWGIEIYSFPCEPNRKWEGYLISVWEASKNDFKPGETFKPDARAKLEMRLHKNDIFEVSHYGVIKRYRVVKMNKDKSGKNAGVCYTDVNNVITPRPTPSFSTQRLFSMKAKKVHVPPVIIDRPVKRKPVRSIISKIAA